MSATFNATAFIKEELDDVSEEASLPEAESDSTAMTGGKGEGHQAVIKVEPQPASVDCEEEEENVGANKNPPLPPNEEKEVAPPPPGPVNALQISTARWQHRR